MQQFMAVHTVLTDTKIVNSNQKKDLKSALRLKPDSRPSCGFKGKITKFWGIAHEDTAMRCNEITKIEGNPHA